ncbi:MAG: GYD domain-containing protein [Methanobacteriaceae archaeon]
MKYIVLGNWTDQGRKSLDEVGKRVETIENLVEEQNGSMSTYFTMGEYDFVALVDMPDEESMVKILMKVNSMKAAVTKTLKAWPTSEFVKMI